MGDAFGVDREGLFPLRLGGVDLGEGRAVDHHFGAEALRPAQQAAAVRDVRLAPGEPESGPAAGARLGHHRPAEHAGATQNQAPH